MAEPRNRKRWKIIGLVLCAILLLAGGLGWYQRTALQCSYYAYRLEHASETDRPQWADRLVELGEPAIPKLLACFRKDDRQLCIMARDSIEKLMTLWGLGDPRCAAVVERFFDSHPHFSSIGQITALHLLPSILKTGVIDVNARARTIVSAGLKDRVPELREAAILAATHGELHLLTNVVPLLHDPEPGVRFAAMSAVGPNPQNPSDAPVISSDELLKWLNDPDPKVRRLCETTLIGPRGLREAEVRLGRMLTSPNPSERLELLLQLPEEKNLLVWLQRLSNDSDSAVRAGAARAAMEQEVDFAERLEEMSRQDPDETVRKIASHYAKRYRAH